MAKSSDSMTPALARTLQLCHLMAGGMIVGAHTRGRDYMARPKAGGRGRGSVLLFRNNWKVHDNHLILSGSSVQINDLRTGP